MAIELLTATGAWIVPTSGEAISFISFFGVLQAIALWTDAGGVGT